MAKTAPATIAPQLVALTALHPAPWNPRTIRDVRFKNLCESIQADPEFLWQRPILADAAGEIFAGNMRFRAVQHLGWREVPAIVSDVAPRLAKERAMRDNNQWGDLVEQDVAELLVGLQMDGADLTLLGFPDDELTRLLDSVGALGDTPVPEAQIDRAAELQAQWGTAVGDLWEAGAHRLICGDSGDGAVVARLLDGERADCVFTSPPYAVGIDYGAYEDTIANLRAMLPQCARRWQEVVVPGGFAVVNFGDIASGRDVAGAEGPCEYPMAVDYWPVFREAGWVLWSRRIWCKPNPRVHSPWCIQSNRAATDWEHLWTWKAPGVAIIQRVDGEYRSASGWIDTSLMHGVDIGKETHGAGMALGIAEWMLTVHSRAGAGVFEPFLGTGTTMIAAERLGRRCYGAELDPGSLAISLQRLADLGLTPRRVEAWA